jgi:hypothetical protein
VEIPPVDIWNPKIFAAIDESDLSFGQRMLASVRTTYCFRATRFAGHHFNDELLGLICAEELETRAREKEKSEDQKPEA